jgi:6-phosphofructokinase 1
MGRRAGWIATGAALARRSPGDAPHIILSPEILFNEAAFLDKVRETIAATKYCIVVVGEGLRNAAGEEIAADASRVDAFGHPVLSGAAEHLADLVTGKLSLKSRTVKLGYAQRAAAHFASLTDVREAAACGEAAVRAAVAGQSGFMVKLVRLQSAPYQWTTGLQPLGDIANIEHFMGRDWFTEDGFMPNETFLEYARPLIEGEVKVPMEGGLPRFAELAKVRLDKKLSART